MIRRDDADEGGQRLLDWYFRLPRRQQLIVVIAMITLGLVVAVIYHRTYLLKQQPTASTQPTTATIPFTVTSGLPDMPLKPKPLLTTFHDCPADGDNPGEIEQNRLKNRIDDAHWIPVTFDAVAKLAWPRGTERRDRDHWTSADATAIARWEGIPISIEGFLTGAKLSGPESCNCHGADPEMRDFWLTRGPGEDRSGSIVVEPTPRARAKHSAWTVGMLNRIARDQQHVRISGWLFFDPEHPDQIGKTRGTIWEIHPVMQIEVNRDGQWTPLD